MTEPKRRGRPPKPPGTAIRDRVKSLTVRLEVEEHTAFVELCARRGTNTHAELARLVRRELELPDG